MPARESRKRAHIGCNDEQHFRRLRYVTNHQRFCVLPAGRQHNLASNVLAKTLKRLPSDFENRWEHPVLVVETFVDPSRHHGTSGPPQSPDCEPVTR
ncbi:MAG: Druantia anti-phage system protein DruA [Acidimicrobiales bacterium]